MTFETKRKEAEKYKETGKSFYIETLAKAKQIEPAHLAEIITQHSQAYTIAYAQLEAWRDQQEAQILKDFTI